MAQSEQNKCRLRFHMSPTSFAILPFPGLAMVWCRKAVVWRLESSGRKSEREREREMVSLAGHCAAFAPTTPAKPAQTNEPTEICQGKSRRVFRPVFYRVPIPSVSSPYRPQATTTTPTGSHPQPTHCHNVDRGRDSATPLVRDRLVRPGGELRPMCVPCTAAVFSTSAIRFVLSPPASLVVPCLHRTRSQA